MGTKILINRIEKMFAFLLIPTSIFIINSLIFIVSLIVEQKQEVYIFIFTVYSISAFIIILIYLLFRINNRIGKQYIIIKNGSMQIVNNCIEEVQYKDIKEIDYFKCASFMIPFLYIYKSQQGGRVILNLKDGKKISFTIFYNEFKSFSKIIKIGDIKIKIT